MSNGELQMTGVRHLRASINMNLGSGFRVRGCGPDRPEPGAPNPEQERLEVMLIGALKIRHSKCHVLLDPAGDAGFIKRRHLSEDLAGGFDERHRQCRSRTLAEPKMQIKERAQPQPFEHHLMAGLLR